MIFEVLNINTVFSDFERKPSIITEMEIHFRLFVNMGEGSADNSGILIY